VEHRDSITGCWEMDKMPSRDTHHCSNYAMMVFKIQEISIPIQPLPSFQSHSSPINHISHHIIKCISICWSFTYCSSLIWIRLMFLAIDWMVHSLYATQSDHCNCWAFDDDRFIKDPSNQKFFKFLKLNFHTFIFSSFLLVNLSTDNAVQFELCHSVISEMDRINRYILSSLLYFTVNVIIIGIWRFDNFCFNNVFVLIYIVI